LVNCVKIGCWFAAAAFGVRGAGARKSGIPGTGAGGAGVWCVGGEDA
jgi:hypothetical protein